MCDNKAEENLDSTLNYSTECAALNMSLEGENFGNDETHALQAQLIKFIELVPKLKQINSKENFENIANLTQNLESLDLDSKGISDLQILQSIMDYISDLQDKAYN